MYNEYYSNWKYCGQNSMHISYCSYIGITFGFISKLKLSLLLLIHQCFLCFLRIFCIEHNTDKMLWNI